MISPVSSAIITGGIVTTENLITEHKLSFRQLAGVGIYVIVLAMINEVNSDLAAKFGLVVMITAVFLYAPKIINTLGVGK